jgi:hypothetical protein
MAILQHLLDISKMVATYSVRNGCLQQRIRMNIEDIAASHASWKFPCDRLRGKFVMCVHFFWVKNFRRFCMASRHIQSYIATHRRKTRRIESNAKCCYLKRDFASGVFSVWGPLPAYDPILPPYTLYTCVATSTCFTKWSGQWVTYGLLLPDL